MISPRVNTLFSFDLVLIPVPFPKRFLDLVHGNIWVNQLNLIKTKERIAKIAKLTLVLSSLV